MLSACDSAIRTIDLVERSRAELEGGEETKSRILSAGNKNIACETDLDVPESSDDANADGVMRRSRSTILHEMERAYSFSRD